jgi:hypothetical protein
VAHAKSDRWIEAAKLALLAMIIMPVTVIIHELGHFATPLLFSLPAQLHPGSVSGGAELDHAPAWMVALQTGGGPLMSVLMGLGGGALYHRDPRRLWAMALAASAISRFVMDIAYLGARFLFLLEGRVYAARPEIDEYRLAEALALPPPLVSGAAAAFFLGLIWLLLRRTQARRRLPFVLALIAGIALGTNLWFMLAPPVLVSAAG